MMLAKIPKFHEPDDSLGRTIQAVQQGCTGGPHCPSTKKRKPLTTHRKSGEVSHSLLGGGQPGQASENRCGRSRILHASQTKSGKRDNVKHAMTNRGVACISNSAE